jgi:hypothetical protein
VPATPANTITPRRAINNYQVRNLINLGYVALSLGPDERVHWVDHRLIRDADFLQNRHKLLPKAAARVLGLPHIDNPKTVRALPSNVD